MDSNIYYRVFNKSNLLKPSKLIAPARVFKRIVLQLTWVLGNNTRANNNKNNNLGIILLSNFLPKFLSSIVLQNLLNKFLAQL